jgi:tetratricopeptide (TPR) repeat protein
VTKSALIIQIGTIQLAMLFGLTQDTSLAEREGALPKPVNSREERCCQEAEKTSLAALAEAERFGPLDLRLAQSLNALARVYFDQGRYLEAGSLLERALSIQEKTPGRDHSSIVLTLNSLAELRTAQGSYTELKPNHSSAAPSRSKRKPLDRSIARQL